MYSDNIIVQVLCKDYFLSKLIFNNVKFIHRVLYNRLGKFYKWIELICEPHLLISYNYFSELKKYYQLFPKSRYSRKRSMVNCTKYGHLDIFIYLSEVLLVNQSRLKKLSDNKMALFLQEAVSAGRLDIIQHMTKKYEISDRLYDSLAMYSPISHNFEVFLFIMEKLSHIHPKSIDIYTGVHEMLRLTLTAACENNNLKVVEWLVTQNLMNTFGVRTVGDRILTLCIWRCFEYDYGESFKMLVDRIGVTNIDYNQILQMAFKGYKLNIFRYLYQEVVSKQPRILLYPCTYSCAIAYASISGDLESVKSVYEDSKKYTTPAPPVTLIGFQQIHINVLDHLVTKGNMELLEWFHLNTPFGFGAQALQLSVAYGHLKVLKWSQANRQEIIPNTIFHDAVASGDFETMQWVHKNIPNTLLRSGLAFDKLFQHSRVDIIDWVIKNRTELNEGDLNFIFNGVAAQCNIDLVKSWLEMNADQYITHDAMNIAASHGNLENIIWLHNNRTEGCTKKALINAADDRHYEVVKWLHQNRSEISTVDAIVEVAIKGNSDLLKFLLKNSKQPIDEIKAHPNLKGYVDRVLRNNFFYIAMWMIENDIADLSEEMVISILRKGNLEMLIPIYKNKTFEEMMDLIGKAFIYYQIPTIDWILSIRPEIRTFFSHTYLLYLVHVADGNMECKANCGNIIEHVLQSNISNKIETLEWIFKNIDHRISNNEIVMSVIKNDCLEVYQWMEDINQIETTHQRNLLEIAFKESSIKISQYLFGKSNETWIIPNTILNSFLKGEIRSICKYAINSTLNVFSWFSNYDKHL